MWTAGTMGSRCQGSNDREESSLPGRWFVEAKLNIYTEVEFERIMSWGCNPRSSQPDWCQPVLTHAQKRDHLQVQQTTAPSYNSRNWANMMNFRSNANTQPHHAASRHVGFRLMWLMSPSAPMWQKQILQLPKAGAPQMFLYRLNVFMLQTFLPIYKPE